MTFDDLSRSLVTFEPNSTMTVVVEMGESSWLVSGLVPGVDRQPLKKLDATIEGGILMAGTVGQIAVPLITSLAASALVRWTKSWRSDAHDDGCGAWR